MEGVKETITKSGKKIFKKEAALNLEEEELKPTTAEISEEKFEEDLEEEEEEKNELLDSNSPSTIISAPPTQTVVSDKLISSPAQTKKQIPKPNIVESQRQMSPPIFTKYQTNEEPKENKQVVYRAPIQKEKIIEKETQKPKEEFRQQAKRVPPQKSKNEKNIQLNKIKKNNKKVIISLILILSILVPVLAYIIIKFMPTKTFSASDYEEILIRRLNSCVWPISEISITNTEMQELANHIINNSEYLDVVNGSFVVKNPRVTNFCKIVSFFDNRPFLSDILIIYLVIVVSYITYLAK